jgi:putative copper resistance protein D
VPLPPYTFATAATRWTLDVPVLLGLLLALALYGYGVLRAHRAGRRWPWWRTAAFVALGLGSVAVCTMSSLATYDHTVLWAFAAQVTLLISIVPVCLATGDPLGLVRAGLGERGGLRWERIVTGPVVRVLTFPVVAALLALVTQLVIFLSPLLSAALHSRAVLDLVYLGVVVVGSLLALPLLGAEVLPAWCTEPLRLLFAALDGLLDAIPGIIVMTTGTLLAKGVYTHGRPAWAPTPRWDEHVAGALMLALSEVVGIPILVVLFARWARTETRRDRLHPAAPAADIPMEAAEPVLERPWWETEGFGRGRTEEFRPRR